MKRQFKLTKKLIDGLPPCPADSASREVEYSDTDVAGLRLVVNRLGRKSWLLRYTMTGQKRSMKLGDYPAVEVAQARQLAIDARSQAAKGIDPQGPPAGAPAALTLAGFVAQDYMPHAKAAKRSFKDDETRLRLHVLPEFGALALEAIKTQDIQAFHDRKRVERCAATANRILALMKRIFNLAILWGKLEKNPVRGVKMHQENNQRQRYLAGEELRRFWAALDDEPNQTAADLFRFLLATGVRRHEGLTARWSDIDMDQALWYVPVTKTGRGRVVMLSEIALEILRKRHREGSEWVFPSADGRGGHLGDPTKAFKRVTKAAGLSGLCIHTLRHSHASMLVQSGMSLQVAQAMLGHQSASTTARYAHLASTQLRHAAGRVSELLREAAR